MSKIVFASIVFSLLLMTPSFSSAQTPTPAPTPSRQQQIQQHTQMAREFLSQNRPDLAIPEYKALVALEPNNVDARGNLGVLLFFQNQFAEAIPQLRAALKLQPTLYKIQSLLGTAEVRTGDLAAGTHDLETAFANLKEQKLRMDTGLQLIDLYSKSGQLYKAGAVIGQLRDQDPTNVALIYSSYRLYSDLADESRLSLLVVAPKSAQTHQMMAHELARQGNTKEAIENYRAALQIAPKLPGLHFELAELLNSSPSDGGPEAAEKEYQAALEVNPNDTKSEYRLGDIAAQRNDLEAAQKHYARALQIDPDDTDANIGMAKVLMAQNQREKAAELLKHAIQVDPTIAVAHFRLSTIYRQENQPEEAKRELAEYQKYKDMKEKLKEMYRAMRLEPGKQEPAEPDARE